MFSRKNQSPRSISHGRRCLVVKWPTICFSLRKRSKVLNPNSRSPLKRERERGKLRSEINSNLENCKLITPIHSDKLIREIPLSLRRPSPANQIVAADWLSAPSKRALLIVTVFCVCLNTVRGVFAMLLNRSSDYLRTIVQFENPFQNLLASERDGQNAVKRQVH